jgi:polyferredoxin
LIVVACLAILITAHIANAAQRFPPPDFESGYELPGTTTPAPRSLAMEYVDVAVLLGALGVASWLTLRKRSRKGIVALSLLSLAYFGFYRTGCLCAIGSVQNVALALFDRSYVLPGFALAIFAAPLVFGLFFGRSFCAAVCPQGAMQDLVLIKPVKLPAWLEHGLSVIPFIFLGVGVLLAATGSTFLICRYDPFVPFFRLSGGFTILMIGGAFLLIGMFVGRPYCRFFCPYGALLKLTSVVSKWRVRTTPDYCTQCQLCEHSCPFGAMRTPSSGAADPKTQTRERKRLAAVMLLVPCLMLGIGWVGSLFGKPASLFHPKVALAEKYLQNEKAPVEFPPQSPEALELDRAGKDPKALLAEAVAIRRSFVLGGWLLGAWVGLVVGAKLISLSVRRHRTDFEPDRGDCVGCGRCFEDCPNERVRLGLLPAAGVEHYVQAQLQARRQGQTTAVKPPSATAQVKPSS